MRVTSIGHSRWSGRTHAIVVRVFVWLAILVLAALFIAVPKPPSASALSADGTLKCEPGVSYTVNTGGDVFEINETATGFTSTGTKELDLGGNDVNGLAIGQGGQSAFAYGRYSGYVRIYEWQMGT